MDQVGTKKLRANRRNNSQHGWVNYVGSCCVRVGSGVQTDATTQSNVESCCVLVGSGVQTDATTQNNVGTTMLEVVALLLAVVYKRMQQLTTMLEPAVHRGEGYNSEDFGDRV